MKKLLVLVLVFAMVSTANATLSLKIVDNYALNPIPANLGKFGIESTTAYVAMEDLYFVVISAVPIYPTGGTVLPAAPAGTFIETSVTAKDALIVGFPAGWDGILGYVGDPSGAPVPAGLYLDGITSNVGNTVKLYAVTADWELSTLQDTVTLVPEPMTLALLGLGGLFLRRRK